MNFGDLISSVAKESRTGATKGQVEQILMVAIRCIIEEMVADKGKSEVVIMGFGTFYLYLNRRAGASKEKEVIDRWSIGFKRSKNLKAIVNDRVALENASMGNRWLYPEFHENDKVASFREEVKYQNTIRTLSNSNLYRNERFKKKEEQKKLERKQRREAKRKNYTDLLPDEDEV